MTTATGALTVTETDGISDIDAADWDALAGSASVYSAHAWLAYVEQYGDCVPRYLSVWAGERLLGALPTYRFDAAIPRFYDPQFLVPGVAVGRPVLIGGTRQGYVTDFLLAPDLDEPTRRAVLRALVDRLRAEPAALTTLLYLPDDVLTMVRPEVSEQDVVFLVDARARLEVPAGGLAALRPIVSNSTRSRIRNEMRMFAEAGCQAEVCRLSECHTSLGPLSAQVLCRYGHATTPEAEAKRFAAQARDLDDICYIVLARQAGRVVGFTQFFAWQGVLYARLHGVDDSIARSAALYFNLTYYQAITFAAEHGFTAIDFGCDSYETKVRRGSHLDPLWGVMLDPGWHQDTTTALARASRTRLAEFAGWDPAVRTPLAAELLDLPEPDLPEEEKHA